MVFSLLFVQYRIIDVGSTEATGNTLQADLCEEYIEESSDMEEPVEVDRDADTCP